MENVIKLLKNKKITYKEYIIMELVEKFPNKTIRNYCLIIGMDYTRATESFDKLLKLQAIEKTNENPAKYYIK